MVRGPIYLQMETYMLVHMFEENQKVKELISGKMEAFTLETLKME